MEDMIPVEGNYRNKITLDDIADTLHVNRSYLSRFYKNKTGVNLFDAILNKRIEAAKDYLRNKKGRFGQKSLERFRKK